MTNNVINFNDFKQKKEVKKMTTNHDDQILMDRITRIKQSINRINQLMAELKNSNKEEK